MPRIAGQLSAVRLHGAPSSHSASLSIFHPTGEDEPRGILMSNDVDADPHGPALARRVLIVGGVAGGASCAARLRRLDESAEIVVFDRGPFVSFANCGLPYYVGDVIEDERKLLVASPELFRERFNIEVHTSTEVIAVDRPARTITVRDLRTGARRRSATTRWSCHRARRRSGRRCREWTARCLCGP